MERRDYKDLRRETWPHPVAFLDLRHFLLREFLHRSWVDVGSVFEEQLRNIRPSDVSILPQQQDEQLPQKHVRFTIDDMLNVRLVFPDCINSLIAEVDYLNYQIIKVLKWSTAEV